MAASSIKAEMYYINTYDYDDNVEMYVYAKAINLNSASIENSIKLNKRGIIINKIPLSVNIENHDYLLALSENGGFNKNSEMGIGDYVVYHHILDPQRQFQLVHSDSVVGAMIGFVNQYPSESGFRFGLRSSDNTHDIMPEGIYRLNGNFEFEMERQMASDVRPGVLNDSCGYNFLEQISWADDSRFYTNYPYSFELLKLNNNLSRITDSLSMPKADRQIIQFAYHPGRDKIYIFNLNYEVHGQFMDKGRAPGAPAPRVFIYDPGNFDLLETQTIADYPEGDYPSGDEGISDIVGDFIVYYFFDDDWIGRFNPAMLFIFDTRANEASWLRVGWR